MPAAAAKYLGEGVARRWYLVANRGEAAIYADSREQKFAFVERFTDPQAHLTESELVSDRPGRSFSHSGGGVVKHAYEPRVNHHEEAAIRFARKLAEELETAQRNGRFDELVLVAEPHFLGLLRGALPPASRELIKHEVRREYAQGSPEEIRELVLRAIEAGK